MSTVVSGDARRASVERQTRETRIRCTLDLDGSGEGQISTGVSFFDHMIDQLARHGLFDINLTCVGDLEIDSHHSVEDCALVLGRAFREALGNRAGITRMGEATVPMDEALVQAVVDCSGRPHATVDVGAGGGTGLGTTLLHHFFESFVTEARITLHLRVLAGRDAHHMAEACFKAFARALRSAVAIDDRRGFTVASTKGTLSS